MKAPLGMYLRESRAGGFAALDESTGVLATFAAAPSERETLTMAEGVAGPLPTTGAAGEPKVEIDPGRGGGGGGSRWGPPSA